jgi:putative DNA primase/helicase
VSCAFAATTIYLVNEQSGGINLIGSSSIGKTTVLKVAGSVCGGGGVHGYIRQWRVTANGIEPIAALHCDMPLLLDETGQVPAKEAAEAAYLMANGQGKSRARRDGSSRLPLLWRVFLLSTGEVGFGDKIKESGRRATAGTAVRILDVPADTGKYGVFESLHGAIDGAAFSRELQQASELFYGAPIRAFLQELTADPSTAAEWFKARQSKFVRDVTTTDADGQVMRTAGRFGIVAAAGELATEWSITGWPKGAATAATATCFEAWLDRRGSSGPAEIDSGIAQIRHFIEQHGESRFDSIDDGPVDNRLTINRCGFRRHTPAGIEYLVLPESFSSELRAGFDPKMLARSLIERGLLLPSTQLRAQDQVLFAVRLEDDWFVQLEFGLGERAGLV